MSDVGPGRYRLLNSIEISDHLGNVMGDLVEPGTVALRGVYKTPIGEVAAIAVVTEQVMEAYGGRERALRDAKRTCRTAALERCAEGCS